MTEDEALELVEAYGRLLNHTADRPYGAPQSLLPAPKGEIKEALQIALRVTEDDAVRKQLRSGYVELARFLPDEYAQVASDFQRAVESGDTQQAEQIPEMKAIARGMTDESQALLEELRRVDGDVSP